jgi:hypothetical protein
VENAGQSRFIGGNWVSQSDECWRKERTRRQEWRRTQVKPEQERQVRIIAFSNV